MNSTLGSVVPLAMFLKHTWPGGSLANTFLTTLPKSTHEQSESLHGSAQIYWRNQVQVVAPRAKVDRTGGGGWPQSKPLEYKVSKAENTVVDHKLNHMCTKWAKPKCWPQSEPHDTRSTSRHPTEQGRDHADQYIFIFVTENIKVTSPWNENQALNRRPTRHTFCPQVSLSTAIKSRNLSHIIRLLGNKTDFC